MITYKKWLKRYSYKSRLHIKTRTILLNTSTALPSTKYTLYVPNYWSFFLLSSKTSVNDIKIIYLSSAKYFFKIPYPTKLLLSTFDVYTSSINFTLLTKTHYIYLYFQQLQSLIYLFSQVQFTRMKFRGKGYYIYKTLRNTIAPNFGYAHRLYIYAYFVSLKFLSKTSIILFGLKKNRFI